MTSVTVQVYQTWGKRCTYIRFLTTKEDEELPTFVSDTKEAYMEIWGKTKEGFRLQLQTKVRYPKVREDFTIMEKAPKRAFSLLKAPTRAFTFKTLLRHYDK